MKRYITVSRISLSSLNKLTDLGFSVKIHQVDCKDQEHSIVKPKHVPFNRNLDSNKSKRRFDKKCYPSLRQEQDNKGPCDICGEYCEYMRRLK